VSVSEELVVINGTCITLDSEGKCPADYKYLLNGNECVSDCPTGYFNED